MALLLNVDDSWLQEKFHSLVVSATTQKFEKEEDENIVLCIFFKIILSYSRLFIYSFTFKSLGGPNA